MKRIISLLLTVLLLCGSVPACAEGTRTVAASFYPIYILLLNVTDGAGGISAKCLASENTGCLHDYQLLPGDLITLSESDALFICGAGMETYLDTVAKNFPELSVIDTSEGIELIGEDAEDGHEHEDGEAHEVNAHIWLSVPNAIIMVESIRKAMCEIDPDNEEKYTANAAAYTARLQALEEYMISTLAPFAGRKLVTFHEAFPYFAEHYGLTVCEVVSIEHGDSISAKRLAEVIAAVEENGLPPLFTEPQYSDAAAKTVAAETGARIYELDPIVTGTVSLTAYEDGMKKNADTLAEALGQTK